MDKMRKKASGVERIVKYKAADDTLHDTYAAAVKHSSQYALETWLANWLHEEGIDHCGTIAQALAPALRNVWRITKRKEQP